MTVDIRQVFDSVSAIWVVVDNNGKVLLTSKYLDKFQHVFPVPLPEGTSLFDLIPDPWKGIAKNVLNALEHAVGPSNLEASIPDDQGKETHFEIKCTAIRNEASEVHQVFIEAIDVTPQKIFEKRITIVAREYQTLIEDANAVIIGTDVGGYVTEWNDMAFQVTGFSKNESYIQKLSDFLISDSQEQFAEAIASVLAGNVVSNYEMNVRAKDSRPLSLLINATPRRSANGEVVGVLIIGQDITELTAYRRSLEEKVKERTIALKSALESEKKLVEVKDRFVSMASHEFRSPISYIHRNIGLIRDHIGSLEPDEVRQRLMKIQSQAEHLTSLLEDVLTMGKTGAANTRIKANVSRVDLKEFFHRIIEEVRSNTHHTHVVELDFPVSSLSIDSDENLLRNIFVNLLTNAIKFSPQSDRVEMSVVVADQEVECRIRDYGVGIGAVDLPRIFEPFHRGENVRQIKGTGLGLPIVKRAVETLGGQVSVDSMPGEGTTFIVKLNIQHA